MGDIEYEVQGFLTVRRDSLRVPLRGSLTVRADPGSGHFTGNLALRPAAIGRRIFGVSLFGATVRIDAESLVDGRIDEQGRMSATVTVDAVLTAARFGRVDADPRRLLPHRHARGRAVALQARLRPGTRRPPGRPISAAAVHRVRMADSRHQPAGVRPGERRGHRPHPEYVAPVRSVSSPVITALRYQPRQHDAEPR